jgi:hypothetical protein
LQERAEQNYLQWVDVGCALELHQPLGITSDYVGTFRFV